MTFQELKVGDWFVFTSSKMLSFIKTELVKTKPNKNFDVLTWNAQSVGGNHFLLAKPEEEVEILNKDGLYDIATKLLRLSKE